jgi:hypothetical protein
MPRTLPRPAQFKSGLTWDVMLSGVGLILAVLFLGYVITMPLIGMSY